METFKIIVEKILWIVAILGSYQVVLQIISFIFKAKKFEETDKRFKYAFLIAARNEELVIHKLIDSIRKQDYPSELIEIFVVCDNCTDNTAKVARDNSAIVYEKNNPNERRKGYALKYLVEQIDKDYGIESFDGYFIFDADNLLAKNYVHEMNKAFANLEYDFINSYISVKNFDKSFIASYSSLTLYSNNFVTIRPRSLIGLSTRLRGTGGLIRSHLLKDGWNFTGLCEDNEFSYTFIAKGVRSTYCEAAEFFDEQPPTLKLILRQRMRWSRGRFIVFLQKVGPLFKGIFTTKGIRQKASCYDGIISLFPLGSLSLIIGFIYPILVLIYGIINRSSDISALTKSLYIYFSAIYIESLFSSLITIIREHAHIRVHPLRLVIYFLFWPFIKIIISYVDMVSLFIPVKWKPIPHNHDLEIEKIYDKKPLFDIKKHPRIKLFQTSIILFLASCALVLGSIYLYGIKSIEFNLDMIYLSFIPFLIFLILILLIGFKVLNKKIVDVINAIVIIPFILFVIFFSIKVVVYENYSKTTNVEMYQKALKHVEELEIFPDSIDRLYYQKSIFNDEVIVIRCSSILNEDKINNYTTTYKDKLINYDYKNQYNLKYVFFESQSKMRDFDLYVLNEEETTLIIAINEKTNEVIFYYSEGAI